MNDRSSASQSAGEETEAMGRPRRKTPDRRIASEDPTTARKLVGGANTTTQTDTRRTLIRLRPLGTAHSREGGIRSREDSVSKEAAQMNCLVPSGTHRFIF